MERACHRIWRSFGKTRKMAYKYKIPSDYVPCDNIQQSRKVIQKLLKKYLHCSLRDLDHLYVKLIVEIMLFEGVLQLYSNEYRLQRTYVSCMDDYEHDVYRRIINNHYLQKKPSRLMSPLNFI